MIEKGLKIIYLYELSHTLNEDEVFRIGLVK